LYRLLIKTLSSVLKIILTRRSHDNSDVDNASLQLFHCRAL